MKEVSFYFHIPFCRRRCGYCDFNTFAGMNQYIPAYVNALCREVETVLRSAPDKFSAHSIYFGGGTPSLLHSDQFQQILKQVLNHAVIPDHAEITLEANPETVSEEEIKVLRKIGFNRISFGMQSASKRDLQILDRQHENRTIVNAVSWSKRAGFEHINLDLIFGIPGQSLERWQRTLELAYGLGIDHFSIYSLILEDGTRLKSWVDKGLLEKPDEDLAADMYELTMDFMEKRGYVQYEISNWAASEEAKSRHNLQYWKYLPYFGFGAGAHGFWQNTRTENTGLIVDFINLVNSGTEAAFPAGPAARNITRLSRWERIQENMMVSLRLTQEGVSLANLSDQYQVDIFAVFKSQIGKLVRQGLLEISKNEDQIRLTRKGRLFGNRVFSEFIDNPIPGGFDFSE